MVPSGQPVDSGIVGCPIVYHRPAGEKKEEPQAASVGTETAEQYNAGIFTSPSQTTGEQETAVDTETRAVAAGSAEEYTAYLEGKLKKMLESVRGLGGVEVMITLESSEERIVEKDMTADRSQTEEQVKSRRSHRHFSVWKPTKSRCWKMSHRKHIRTDGYIQ